MSTNDRSRNDLIATIMGSISPIVTRAVDRGILLGRELERLETAKRFGEIAKEMEQAAKPKGIRQRISNPANPEPLPFGFINGAIRRAMDKYGRAPAKLTIAQIIEHTQEFAAPRHLADGQIRPALKGLTKNKEIERLDRGLYRAGPKLVVPE